MIRKFRFEAEIYESLNCLPMAARRKLDALGIKIHLAQWGQLGRGERLMICHAPSNSEEERDALRTFIEEATVARCGSAPKILSEESRKAAFPPAYPPPALARKEFYSTTGTLSLKATEFTFSSNARLSSKRPSSNQHVKQ